mgnify:FL=1
MKYRLGLYFPRSLSDAYGHPGPAITVYTDPERRIVRPALWFVGLVLAGLALLGVLS